MQLVKLSKETAPCFDKLLCGCQVAEQMSPLSPCFSPMIFNHPRPKRDLLLCVARPFAVTLSWHAPLSKAQSPGLSVSSTEPSAVFLSRFCLSSSRSLGRCLLLRQRSRPNFLSYLIGSLLHQDHRDVHPAPSRDRTEAHRRRQQARQRPASRA